MVTAVDTSLFVQPSETAAPITAQPSSSTLRPPLFSSDELLQGRREAWVEHRGEIYRLRLTGSGKLYLTK